MSITTNWKSDNYKFVGKAFDFSYANRLNKLLPIIGEVDSKSIDYELTGTGGYGELQRYDGTNLNLVQMQRGFKTVITPEEYTSTVNIGYKQAKVDKIGECRKVGKRLGDAAAMTVYLHAIRMFGRAFDSGYTGGDGVCWASASHPVASLGSSGRTYVADPDAGTYSNLITKALSVANICEAQAIGAKMVTPDGMPLAADFNTLLVSPDLEAEAKKICGENAKLRPLRNPADDTNAANPLYEMQYIVVGGGTIGLTGKQWAICDRELMREICKIVYITRPEVMNHELDNPLIDSFTAYADFGIGWGDARQIIFSNPS